jgi:hypothetical protein
VTVVYLGWPLGSVEGIFRDYEPSRPLDLLVSFAYMKEWQRAVDAGIWPAAHIGQTMLDSGAYTAATTGRTIDRSALIAEQRSGRWTETVALDAIGDHKASESNWRWSVSQGSDAFPTFHMGEPFEVLDRYVAESWKVGLGGVVGTAKGPLRSWLDKVFKRCWPARYHLFGCIDSLILNRYPFHSADSAIWFLQTIRYAHWAMPKGGSYIVKNRPTDERMPQCRYRIEELMDRSARLRVRWRRPLLECESKCPPRPES